MEVNSYFRMKDLINASLQENQHHQAQEYIRQLLLFWQTNKHVTLSFLLYDHLIFFCRKYERLGLVLHLPRSLTRFLLN